LQYSRFSLSILDASARFNSYAPFVSVSRRIGPNTLMHVSGQFAFFSSRAEIEDAEAESNSSGTSVSAGIEQSLSVKTKFLADAGYDATFRGFRAGGGFLWGWEKFRLKMGVSYFKPERTEGFTLPNIGLWWRFKA
jgi:hypothetical protein